MFSQSKSSIVETYIFLNKGQGFIVMESDPGDFNKGISEIKYHGIILNVIYCTCTYINVIHI